MCDVRQLAGRPVGPGGQQLLTVDLSGGRTQESGG